MSQAATCQLRVENTDDIPEPVMSDMRQSVRRLYNHGLEPVRRAVSHLLHASPYLGAVDGMAVDEAWLEGCGSGHTGAVQGVRGRPGHAGAWKLG